jgi:hypothetical protein
MSPLAFTLSGFERIGEQENRTHGAQLKPTL